MLTVGSLFAGIGGFDLGLERAGMQIKWQVENNPYCIRVLEKHWPLVKRYGDVREVKWAEVEPVDLICGGFPCQPVSVASSRKGDKDDRWLWPEFLQAIREVRPRYALVENVPGLLSVGGSKEHPEWKGRFARRVFGDLAESGYDTEWNIVSAADVGAPHLRKRVFILAYPKNQGSSRGFRFSGHAPIFDGFRGLDGGRVLSDCPEEDLADSDNDGRDSESNYETGTEREACSSIVSFGKQWKNTRGQLVDISDPECEGLLSEYIPKTRQATRCSGFEQQWAVEPNVGRVANGVPSRVDRLKCLGNAVVPQVAEFIGKAIIEAEGLTQ